MPTQPIGNRLIPVSQIHSNPDQPRKDMGTESIQELQASIAERGLINPISVFQQGENEYIIIAGERRFSAVCALKWESVDCRIWPPDTQPEEVELLSLVENLQRKDLSPLEEAKGYKALQNMGKTQDQIAKMVGKSQPVVAKMLALLDLPVEIQNLIPQGIITEKHTRSLRRIENKSQQVIVALQAHRGHWSADRTDKHVKELLGEGQSPGLGPGGKPARIGYDPLDRPQFANLPQRGEDNIQFWKTARQGPSAAYRWLYGPDSQTAKACENKTWEDVGFPDFVVGCVFLQCSIGNALGEGLSNEVIALTAALTRHYQYPELERRYEERMVQEPPANGNGTPSA